MSRTIRYAFIIICAVCADVSAQIDTVMRDSLISRYRTVEYKPVRMGISADYGVNSYRSSTLPVPLSNGCDTFIAGRRGGLGASLYSEFPLNNNGLYARTRAGYYDIGGSLRFGEFFTDTASGERRSAEFEHTITTFTKSLILSVGLSYDLLPRLTTDFSLDVGVLFGQRYEKVMSAVGAGGFSGGTRDSLESTGDLPDAEQFQFSVTAGAEMRFPLSQTLDAVPRLYATIPINGTTTYLNHFRIGASIGVSLRADEPPDTIIDYETVKVPEYVVRENPKPPPLEAVIEAYGKSRDGSLEKVIRIAVEDVKAKVAFPFLGYVFFDEASAVIPKRYNLYSSSEDAERRFTPVAERENVKILPLYHDLLNILGSRMRSIPSSKITLTGATSNTGAETNNLALARQRAESVKGYLVNVWRIAPERISVEARLMPQKPSPLASLTGQEENRRVEITSNDERLTDPIIAANIEHIATPSGLVLRPRIVTEAGIESMTARILLGGKEIERFIGDEKGFRQNSTWTISEEALSTTDSLMRIVLDVVDSAGTSVAASTEIPLERVRTERDKEQSIERYSLILFGFDEDELGGKNERTISLVAESFRKMKPKFVSVIGYTDETGSETYNDELSRRRAQKALQSLEKSLKQKRIVLPEATSVDGRGSRDQLYDNSLPEGRFFSRTVNITLGAQR